MVIGCDGVHSKARELVLGHETKLQSSGYAIFRAWYLKILKKYIGHEVVY